ncbi:hypothetical protein KY362_07285 [Candidatus Woesearchaeota archaeon]|nr:hypothetical protein [Candidatus Woesearchaeota archaeon]
MGNYKQRVLMIGGTPAESRELKRYALRKGMHLLKRPRQTGARYLRKGDVVIVRPEGNRPTQYQRAVREAKKLGRDVEVYLLAQGIRPPPEVKTADSVFPVHAGLEGLIVDLDGRGLHYVVEEPESEERS